MIPAHAMHDKHIMGSLVSGALDRIPRVHADVLPPAQNAGGSASFRHLLTKQHDGVPHNMKVEPAKLPPADGKIKEIPISQHIEGAIENAREAEKVVAEPQRVQELKDNIEHGPEAEHESESDECECQSHDDHLCPIENGKYVPHECTDGPWCIDGKFDRAKVYTKAHQIKDKKGYSWNDALKEAWIIAKASK